MKKAVYKVPNGKLLKISLEDDGTRIVSLKITGDFFMHPEENIEQLERFLTGTEKSQTAITKKIADFSTETNTRFFGFDAQSLATAILTAA